MLPTRSPAAVFAINCTSSTAVKSGIATFVGNRASREGSIRAILAKPCWVPIMISKVVLLLPPSMLPKAAASARTTSRESTRASTSLMARHPCSAAARRAEMISEGSGKFLGVHLGCWQLMQMLLCKETDRAGVRSKPGCPDHFFSAIGTSRSQETRRQTNEGLSSGALPH